MEHARDFAPARTGLYVLVTGNIVDGFTFFGPYETRDAAEGAAERRGDRIGDDTWAIAPLCHPDEEDGGEKAMRDATDSYHAKIAD